MFAVIFICGNLYFCGSLEKSQKSQKLEPAKISCHTVKPNQSDSDSTYTISVTSLRHGQQKVTIVQKTNKPKQAMNFCSKLQSNLALRTPCLYGFYFGHPLFFLPLASSDRPKFLAFSKKKSNDLVKPFFS